MSEESADTTPEREARNWPTWLYLALFLGPASVTFSLMAYVLSQEMLFSAITALAVMNGSINSVIAYMTIRLDGHSNEALEHLETIMTEMDELEDTLDDANKMVSDFTGDLDEAKALFQKVGVDLRDLDLESVADIVERIKENRGGINSILDNLKSMEIEGLVSQARGIDWRSMLSAAEEIMGFIEKRNQKTSSPMNEFKPVLNVPVPDDEDVGVEPEWSRYRDSQFITPQTAEEEEDEEEVEEEDEEEYVPQARLVLSRERPKKTQWKLERAPKKNLNLKR